MTRERIYSVDLLRGMILVLMAIDHVNYFICKNHPYEFWGLPLPQYQNVIAFFTRFITHICAPGFFLLLGVGMVLFARSRQKIGWPETKITRYFITRGLILVSMQFMLENPAWFVGLLSDQSGRLNQMVVPGEGERVWIFFGVLFALGAAMICWALMRRLRNSFLFGISLSLILLSQILIPSADKVKEWVFPLMRVLVIPGRSGILQVFYPLIPWLGIAGLGIILGRVISQNEKTAYRRVFWGGALFVSLFLFFRFMGGFGNFHTHVNITWMNVLNLTKYPPSLTFILLTLGICLFLMWLFSKSGKTFHNGKNPLLVFGRAPLFFYVSHLYLFAWIGFAFPHGAGHGILYLIWFFGLLILYPLCSLYGKFKQKKSAQSIWRFF